MSKRFYWLKLKENFFNDKLIKYIRGLPEGDKILNVYLHIQLLSLKTEGVITREVCDSFSEEITLAIDEPFELVEKTINILTKLKLIEFIDENSFFLTETVTSIGKESESAERMRRLRERKKQQGNAQSTSFIDIDNENPWV